MVKYYYIPYTLSPFKKVDGDRIFVYNFSHDYWFNSVFNKEEIEQLGIEIPEHLALLWIAYE